MFSELYIFIYSCLFGAFLGIIYDLFRLFRVLFLCKFWFVFIQDIFYFLISGIGTFLFILYFNFGEIRFYILLGEAIGWMIYYLTLGYIFYRYSSKIAKFMKMKTLLFYNNINHFYTLILGKLRLI